MLCKSEATNFEDISIEILCKLNLDQRIHQFIADISCSLNSIVKASKNVLLQAWEVVRIIFLHSMTRARLKYAGNYGLSDVMYRC